MLTLSDLAIGDGVVAEDGVPIAHLRPRSRPSEYEVRPLERAAELADSFRLRYEVYRRLGYVAPRDSGLDIDEYDACALPLGAFDARTRELVGVLRIVTTMPRRRHANLVRLLAAGAADSALMAHVLRPRGSLLPSIVSREITDLVCALVAERAWTMAELSRCLVREDHRGRGVAGLLVERGIAISGGLDATILLGSCLPKHASMYARHDFVPLRSDGRSDFAPSVGRESLILVRPPGAARPVATPRTS